MTVYIYTLSDPTTNKIRYVGKTDDLKERFRGHVNCKFKRHSRNWILSLKRKGLLPVMEVIDIVENDEWQFWEQYWISQIKAWGFNVTNLTVGGDGSLGHKHSEETKKIISFHSKKMWTYENRRVEASKMKRLLNNFFSDKTIHSFYHDVYGEENLTTCEMREKYSLSTEFSRIANGNRFSENGWRLLKNKNTLSELFNNNLYAFYNPKYGLRVCRQFDIKKEFPELRSDALSKLVKGEQSHHNNWTFEMCRGGDAIG